MRLALRRGADYLFLFSDAVAESHVLLDLVTLLKQTLKGLSRTCSGTRQRARLRRERGSVVQSVDGAPQ